MLCKNSFKAKPPRAKSRRLRRRLSFPLEVRSSWIGSIVAGDSTTILARLLNEVPGSLRGRLLLVGGSKGSAVYLGQIRKRFKELSC